MNSLRVCIHDVCLRFLHRTESLGGGNVFFDSFVVRALGRVVRVPIFCFGDSNAAKTYREVVKTRAERVDYSSCCEQYLIICIFRSLRPNGQQLGVGTTFGGGRKLMWIRAEIFGG